MFDDVQQRVKAFITYHIEQTLWLALDENIRAAYAAADKDAKKLINIKPSRMRAQNRRYYVDNAIAGIHSPHKADVCSTDPKGEMYVLLQSETEKITLSHIEIHKGELPRSAKHRKLLAKKNSILESVNYDLFKPIPPDLEDALHLVVIVEHPSPKQEDQATPEQILVAVPYSSWEGYHLAVPLSEMLSSYTDTSSEDHSEMRDIAWPKLRRDLQEKEPPKKAGS